MFGTNTIIGRAYQATIAPKETQAMNTGLTRTGGTPSSRASDRFSILSKDPYLTPRMPLDTAIHWTWRNPLNIIPAALIGATIIDIIAFWL